NVFGQKQNPKGPYAAVSPFFIEALLNNQSPVINGDGQHSRDFTYISNAVDANIRALFTTDKNAVNEVYNVAYGEQTTLEQLINYLQKISGVTIDTKYGSERPGD